MANNDFCPPGGIGLDGNPVRGCNCHPALPPRADGGAVDIDWDFISDREGGQWLTGNIPEDRDGGVAGQSGATIATGFDIGARNTRDIDRLDIPVELKDKLKPYCGKQRQEAREYLRQHPLSITKAEADSLDQVVKQRELNSLIRGYNAAVDAANAQDGCSRVHFEQLPQEAQTAIASVKFQYGSLSQATPSYWQQVTEQRWPDARNNLDNFGDQHAPRRKKEAGLLGSVIIEPTR